MVKRISFSRYTGNSFPQMYGDGRIQQLRCIIPLGKVTEEDAGIPDLFINPKGKHSRVSDIVHTSYEGYIYPASVCPSTDTIIEIGTHNNHFCFDGCAVTATYQDPLPGRCYCYSTWKGVAMNRSKKCDAYLHFSATYGTAKWSTKYGSSVINRWMAAVAVTYVYDEFNVTPGPIVPAPMCYDTLEQAIAWWSAYMENGDYKTGYYSFISSSRCDPSTPESCYLPPSLFEEEKWISAVDTLRYPRYEFSWLTQHAFKEACESMPSLSDNSLQNLSEIIKLVSAAKSGKLMEYLPNALDSAWLQYRYMFCTGVMDAEQAVDYIVRSHRIGSSHVRSDGRANYAVSGIPSFLRYSDVSCHCQLSLRCREVENLSTLWNKLSEVGLAPDTYVLWDMLPYSFVVDWALPIGDVLDSIDDSIRYTPENYDFQQIGFSLSYTGSVRRPGYSISSKHYTRWYTTVPPQICGDYWFDSGLKTVSSGTTMKRVIDTTCLVVQKVR